MTDLPDGFKNLREAMPSQTNIRNYKTSATQDQVLRTLGEMKKSFIADGMSEEEADRRVAMMLEAYGIASQVFIDYFIKNKESL